MDYSEFPERERELLLCMREVCDVGRREIRNTGSGMAKYPSKDAMSLALQCAVNLTLAKE